MPSTKEQTDEHPIIFSGWSIRGILAGEKSETRRIVKPQPPQECPPGTAVSTGPPWIAEVVHQDGSTETVKCPYGQPGDMLFPLVSIPSVRDVYAAGADGVIYSKARGSWRSLKSWKGDPYEKVTIMREGGKKTTRSVHTLVCAAFHGPRPSDSHQVRHLNGDPTNNMPWNLKWGTQEENWRDRKAHGNGISGEDHHEAKFSNDERSHIRWAVKNNLCSQRHAAQVLGVSQRAIYGIIHDESDLEEFEPKTERNIPKWNSRLRLRVEDVRVERLQEISHGAAEAEGVQVCNPQETPRDLFRMKWNDIHGTGAWEENPFVWCVEFSTIDSE